MRLLLVNPWIADVSAYNFWVRPLGLYALAEWAWERGAEVSLADCLAGFPAPGRFLRRRVAQPEVLRGFPRRFCRYGVEPESFRERVQQAGPCDAVLVTSAMAYWYPGVCWTVEEVRQLLPGAPVVLGGVYPTLWPAHARAHAGADLVLPGALGEVGHPLADFLGLPRSPVRPHRPWHELGLHDGATYAAVRTARGCPYRCAYCASARLSGGFAGRDPEAVTRELLALSRAGVADVAFYDDALLADFPNRLGPSLAEVTRRAPGLRFHSPNGLHARLVTEEAAIVLARTFRTIRLALETVDPGRQGRTGAKVRTEDVERAVARLLRAGARADAIGIYLLVGLPGQPLGEVRDGIAFIRSLGVRPYLSEFSPIPGTPTWDELAAAGTVADDLDPLVTNNTFFTRRFGGFPPEELEALFRSVRPERRSAPTPPLPPAEPSPRT
jgi:radical SAM superfamily enzyme YgiQ (UPF0313 family)